MKINKSNNIEKDISKKLYNEKELKKIITRLGAEISRDYEGKNLLLVSILKGSIVTMADLMRAVTIPCEIDFMIVSSYGKGTTSSGAVKIIKDLDHSIEDYDVLLVEDILDSGITLNYLRKMLLGRNPKSIRICTLLDKPGPNRCEDITADYIGTTVPNEFIVGYGLDYAEKYRNLPYIGVLKREIYAGPEKESGEKEEASAGPGQS